MRKPAFCLCENKDADQLHSNCAADQRLCFRYMDSAIPLYLNPKFQASSQTGFLTTMLILCMSHLFFCRKRQKEVFIFS